MEAVPLIMGNGRSANLTEDRETKTPNIRQRNTYILIEQLIKAKKFIERKNKNIEKVYMN